eukprot:TRINITY_DN737_c0_g1_i1.p1 TRINITY_DN737_c0_g1~~TRINITY_DN737_c0_g1_i1.p1  ORF type:complete len:135 (-),score=28.56 TRINITY_DN737_c0_g1_i1:112-516(-)
MCIRDSLSTMCKHILNAQVAIRAPCCKKWFDCSECHAEVSDHPLKKTLEMAMACKKCKRVFRKYINDFHEEDEYCPGCDNHYYLNAETPEEKGKLVVEIEGATEAEMLSAHDPRVKPRGDFASIQEALLRNMSG